MRTHYVTAAATVSLRSCRSITICPNTLISLKTILSIFYSVNSSSAREISIKKIGLSVKGNHDRAEKYIELFKADSEKIFRPFISARAADIFDIRTAIRSSNDVLDSSLYRVHDDDRNISLYVANDSILTLLHIYSDIMSDAGRLITNCENCGQLMITNRSNASLTCGRTTCKKERLYKANDDYKKRAMADPIKETYFNFDNKCRSYRKKLSGYPDLLEKYN